MNGAVRLVRGAAFCAVFAALPLAALAYAGEELASGAQVNVAQARAIALRAVPGEIADEELETEEGGSGLRYTFEIRHGPDVYEVGVDAKTGALLENIVEGKSPQ
jgi:uncharacterized membrane protein YkoI